MNSGMNGGMNGGTNGGTMNGGPITEADVIRALSTVNDPELGRDLVTLGMVRDVVCTGRDVALTVVLTTPACPLKAQIESEVKQALRTLAGANEVALTFDAQVPRDSRLSDRVDIGVKNAIAVGSGKGGVGKTTTAVNLAVALAREGAAVGLLDADVYGPNVPLMMGVTDQRPVSRDGKKITPIEAHGVRLMSIGFLVPAEVPLVWRGPMLHGTLRQFLGDVDWGGLDYLIIDLPPGTGDVQLTLAQSLPLTGAVVVTTPQKVAQADVVKSIAMFQLEAINVPVLGVVENMSAWVDPDTGARLDIFGAGGGEEVAARMKVPYLGAVPLDPLLPAASDGGVPLVISHPESPAARALVAIARDLSAAISVMHMSRPEARFQADPDLALM